MLLQEIKTAQDVINKIAEMRQGMMGDALVSILNEVRSCPCTYYELKKYIGIFSHFTVNSPVILCAKLI